MKLVDKDLKFIKNQSLKEMVTIFNEKVDKQLLYFHSFEKIYSK